MPQNIEKRALPVQKAYSLFSVEKSAEVGDAGFIEGWASTITPDRSADIVDPAGATFTLPLPLLWQHEHSQPIGQVVEAKVGKQGIWVKAKIYKDLTPRISECWQLIKADMRRALRAYSENIRKVPPNGKIPPCSAIPFMM